MQLFIYAKQFVNFSEKQQALPCISGPFSFFLQITISLENMKASYRGDMKLSILQLLMLL